jgi:hypothetical protein
VGIQCRQSAADVPTLFDPLFIKGAFLVFFRIYKMLASARVA